MGHELPTQSAASRPGNDSCNGNQEARLKQYESCRTNKQVPTHAVGRSSVHAAALQYVQPTHCRTPMYEISGGVRGCTGSHTKDMLAYTACSRTWCRPLSNSELLIDTMHRQ